MVNSRSEILLPVSQHNFTSQNLFLGEGEGISCKFSSRNVVLDFFRVTYPCNFSSSSFLLVSEGALQVQTGTNRPFAQLWPGNEVRGIAGWNRLQCIRFSFELSFIFCFGTFFWRYTTPPFLKYSFRRIQLEFRESKCKREELHLEQSRRHTAGVHAVY